MQKKTDTASIPKGRFSRLGKLSSLAGRVAGNMLAESVSELAKGNRPKMKDLLLTPTNVIRVADQLAHMRGAAMKVGQMISMDAGDMLPAQLTDLLSRLRSDAKSMPEKELINLLEARWGESWQKKFIQFPLQPIAAASIGQVHKVITQDLKRLAIKIQYPGIKQSINSDVDNVATLIKMTGLLPRGLDIKPLLAEAKKQLHDEADYALEGRYLDQYAAVIENDDAFIMPVLDKEFSSDTILAMSFVDGIPIEQLVDAPQETRDQVMSQLMRLFFKELFDFQLVQTDPNFANYQYDQDTQKIVLLDFGATRIYTPHMAESYRQLMQNASHHKKSKIRQAVLDIGLIRQDLPEKVQQNITDLAYMACEPLYGESPYDFAGSDLSSRLQHQGMQLGLEKEYAHTPSANAIFLHRKLGGLFLLAIKLKAKVDIQSLFAPYNKA
ncbi:AarF/ABC1/UbiB kinase family protein [Paraglaciecola sp. MB-3u-78]|uniref:ABC1 kinase family protein n=1 Tax=Paraglaciecola sp. MB-3u-78 TaxID=2058332 RepID=UPI000C3234D2|nr:AarF/ABC1/UbiB kinase family protein [Paraglaciecola sp. MB-3u-78]PKG97318.1 ubiquinol-cytochrome C reductase [Paraglaciecola sp. MB-3u-78]